MKKEIREVKTINGKKICCITTPSERWYGKEVSDLKTGNPRIKWFPSVTWIKSYYYTNPYLVKWIADKGLSEADRIRKEAGVRGDKVHQATEDIDKGEEIKIDAKYENKEKGEMEELTADELEAIKSYADYIDIEKPEILANEMTVFCDNEKYEYSGTLDRIWAQETEDKMRQIWIVDLKTSKTVKKDMIIQVSAYSNSDINYKELGITDKEWNNRKLLILLLGYNGYRTPDKPKYKAIEIDDRFDLFDIAYRSWKEENPNAKPKQRDFPLVIKSDFRIEQLKKNATKKVSSVSKKLHKSS